MLKGGFNKQYFKSGIIRSYIHKLFFCTLWLKYIFQTCSNNNSPFSRSCNLAPTDLYLPIGTSKLCYENVSGTFAQAKMFDLREIICMWLVQKHERINNTPTWRMHSRYLIANSGWEKWKTTMQHILCSNCN